MPGFWVESSSALTRATSFRPHRYDILTAFAARQGLAPA